MLQHPHAERSLYGNAYIDLDYRALLTRLCSVNWLQRLIHILSRGNQQDEEQTSPGDQNQANGNPRPPKKPGTGTKTKTRGGN
jgi:hypothetical protein